MRAGGHPAHPHGSQLLSTLAESPCPDPLSHSPSGPSKPTAKGISTGDLSAPPGPSLVCCLALMVKVLAAAGRGRREGGVGLGLGRGGDVYMGTMMGSEERR